MNADTPLQRIGLHLLCIAKHLQGILREFPVMMHKGRAPRVPGHWVH